MEEEKIHLCDYAVAFIDLLGQKAEMPGRHLPDNTKNTIAIVKRSVGKIIGTQNLFQNFYDSYSASTGIYDLFPQQMKDQLPDMAPGELKRQVFSDGFVIYIPLGLGAVKSPVNSIFAMLIASGMLCAVGLAAKGPLRIGIDVAWAVEYRPGELYGSAIAHAYKLESEVAKWPRVVVGEGLVGYLQHYVKSSASDMASQFRREMALLCQSMISQDIDGQNFLHYLGPGFKRAAPAGVADEVVSRAREYIASQIVLWKKEGNKVLEKRYNSLNLYYNNHI